MGNLRRFWVVYPLVLLVLAAVGYTGYWFWLADRIGAGLDDWIAAERAQGRDVVIRTRAVEGFPGRMHIALVDVVYDDPVNERRLQLPSLTGSLSPFTPTRIVGKAEGPAAVDLGRGPAPGRYILSAVSNAIGYDAGDVKIDLGGFELAGPPPVSRFSAGKLTLGLTQGIRPVTGSVGVDAADIVLPASVGSPLGDTVRYLKARLDFKETNPPAALTPFALDAWRQAGGDIEVRALSFGHGEADVAATGTVALDQHLQPIAAFTAQVAGFKESLDALTQAGMVRPKDGALAKAVLGFLAKTPKGGGRPELSVAISVQDQVLSVGPVNLIQLPTVRWD